MYLRIMSRNDLWMWFLAHTTAREEWSNIYSIFEKFLFSNKLQLNKLTHKQTKIHFWPLQTSNDRWDSQHKGLTSKAPRGHSPSVPLHMWPKRMVDKVELREDGTRARGGWTGSFLLENIRKTLSNKFSYYYFSILYTFYPKGLQYCRIPLPFMHFSFVPFINWTVYDCYHTSLHHCIFAVSVLIVGKYLLMHRLSEHQEP